MNRIEILQNLYRLFPEKSGSTADFSLVEKFLQQKMAVKKAVFAFRQRDGLKTPEGQMPFNTETQKTILARLNRLPQPWIFPPKSRFPWLGFWPVITGDGWVGCYALGKKTGKEGLSAEEGRLMELLADRTGLFLEERRLWQCLEKADRQSSLGFLSAAMIHEIRNPLSALSALAQLLPQKKGDAGFMESFERLMLRETGRLTDLTENFLGFLKPTQEKATRIDFTGTVNQMMDLLKPLFTSKKIQLRLTNPAGLYLMGDEPQIKSLVLNLCKNALESAGPGGIVVISTDWLSRAPYGTNPWVRLKVKNNGSSISKENLKNIFAPYFSSKEKGTGLGLAICKKVVENHEGILKASSTNHNTVFQVLLPALPKV